MTIYEYLGITTEQHTFTRDYILNPLQKNVIRKGGGLQYEEPDWEDVRYMYICLNKSVKEINKIIGHKISDSLSKKFNKRMIQSTPKCTKKELYDLLYVQNIPMIDIAKKFGYTSTGSIQNWCKKYGIKMKSNRYLKNKLDVKQLKKLYIDDNLSTRNIAKLMNTTRKTIAQLLVSNNIYKSADDKNLSSFISKHNELQVKVLLNKNEFEKFIVDNNISSKIELSRLLGISVITLNVYLNRFNLKKYFAKDTLENRWLDSIGLPNDKEHRQVRLDEYIVDGYDPNTNTVYEYLGDYWHGNPKLFKSNEYNTKTGKTFGELYENTLKRENDLKNMGYNVISVWENDINPR